MGMGKGVLPMVPSFTSSVTVSRERQRLGPGPVAPGQGLIDKQNPEQGGDRYDGWGVGVNNNRVRDNNNRGGEGDEPLSLKGAPWSLTRAREVGQRVSNHLLLAALAVDGAGSGHVSVEAEELYRAMYTRRSPPSSIATNLILEGLRRSQVTETVSSS